MKVIEAQVTLLIHTRININLHRLLKLQILRLFKKLNLDEIEKTDDIIALRKSLIVESNKLLDQLETRALNADYDQVSMAEADNNSENLNDEKSSTFDSKKETSNTTQIDENNA